MKCGNNLIFDKYRSRYIHIGTTNISFVKMHLHLREKNIHNNAFFLYLINPELADIDPRSDNLPLHLQYKVVLECTLNPWYFFREIVKIPVPGGDVIYDLNIANLATTWALLGNINTYTIIPRQNYKTISACCFYLWIYLFAAVNSTMIFFNKSLTEGKKNLSRLKDIFFLLPKWLVDIYDIKKDANNVERLKSIKRNNEIVIKPPGSNATHADLIARGLTSPLLWYDEISYIPYISIIYACAAPTQSEAKLKAFLNKTPFSVLLTTTPNNIDTPSGEFAHRIRGGSLWFNLSFFDLGYDAVREKMDIYSNLEYNFLYIEFNYKELGRSERWFLEQKRDLIDSIKAKREILLEWPMSSDNSTFTEEELDEVKKHLSDRSKYLEIMIKTIPGIDIHLPSNIHCIFSRMINPNEKFIIGIDCASSEHGRGDYNAAVIVNEFGKMEGVIRHNKVDDFQWCAIIIYLMVYIIPNSIAIIERNSSGISLINKLTKQHKGFNLNKINLSHRIYNRPSKISKNSGEVNYTSEIYYGVHTSSANRDIMMRGLKSVVQNNPEKINMAELFEELKTSEVKNGKIQAMSGRHDDVMMAYSIVLYVLREEYKFIQSKLKVNYSNSNTNRFVKDILYSHSTTNAELENFHKELQNNPYVEKPDTHIESIFNDRYDIALIDKDNPDDENLIKLRELSEKINKREILDKSEILNIENMKINNSSSETILKILENYDSTIPEKEKPSVSYRSSKLKSLVNSILN